jgi:hypothetical protein
MHYETVKERFCGHIIRSDVRPATKEEIAEATKLHNQGKCPHTIVQDEPGWLYDFRNCAICGCSLGIV